MGVENNRYFVLAHGAHGAGKPAVCAPDGRVVATAASSVDAANIRDALNSRATAAMERYVIVLEIKAEDQRDAENAAEGLADAAEALILSVRPSAETLATAGLPVRGEF